mgnify:CR=1 FL=1
MNKRIIGKRLAELRAGESRKKVANRLGISESALRMYETGQRIPRDEIKVRIADYYGLSVQEIFFDNQPHEMCGFDQNEETDSGPHTQAG